MSAGKEDLLHYAPVFDAVDAILQAHAPNPPGDPLPGAAVGPLAIFTAGRQADALLAEVLRVSALVISARIRKNLDCYNSVQVRRFLCLRRPRTFGRQPLT